MKASIICPTFNGGDLLKKSLNAILNQKFDHPYEIIFVDSSSNDGTAQFLDSQSKIHENLHVFNIAQKEFEHGKTRNFAISKSSGELILLLTQDAIPANDNWLATMVETLENNDIAGVFGRHIAHKDHPKLIQRDLDIHFNRMNQTPIRKIEDWDTYKTDTSLRQLLHFFSNNNSGLKKDIWEKIPFPEVDYGEDQTWAKKIIEKGYSLAYQNKSIVHHSHDFSILNWHKRCKTELQFFEKHFNYDLKISLKNAVRKIITESYRDFNYLLNNSCFNFKDYLFSIKKNLVVHLSYTSKFSSVCPYDKHVWTSTQKRKWILKNSSLRKSSKALQNHIESYTPWFAEIDSVKKPDLPTKKLIESCKKAGVIVSGQECYEVIKQKLSNNQYLANKINLPINVPESSIHRMQRSKNWIGDFYSANLVSNVLEEAGINILGKQKYLDFGCSSGSLLRVLRWYSPNAYWHGIDPVKKSINWAIKNLQGINFSVNSKDPPLDFDDASMDGIISISVWSHFGEKAALVWLNEMYRILKPGGWFLFTTHGLRSIYHYAKNIEKEPSRWCAIYDALLTNDFVFEQTWMMEDDAGNCAIDWGTSYIKQSWIFDCIQKKNFSYCFSKEVSTKKIKMCTY